MKIKKPLLALVLMLLLGQTVRAEWTGGSSSGGINDGAVTGNGTYATYGVKFSLARRADMLTEGDINRGNYAGYTRGGAVLMLLLGQTVRAEWTGGSSSGGINDGAVTGNGTYATYGVKFSLARRADMLTEGDINRGNYAGYTRGGAGVVVLKNGDGIYSTSANRNDLVNDAQEFIVDNGKLVTVSNANVSTQEAAALLEVDANSLDSTLRNMVDDGALSGQQSPDVHAHFRFEAFAEYINKNFSDVYNPEGMLYDATKRAEFYDRFTSVLSSKGVSCGITKEEFTSKTGVLVITPIIGFEGGGYLSFPTANEIVEKGLNSVFKTIYDVTGNHYSDRQVPYGDSNGTVGLTELAQYYTMHDINNKPIDNKSGGLAEILDHYSDRQVPYGDSNGTVGLTELAQYYTMHDINNKPIDNKSGGLAEILARKYQGTNYRYGFGVLGLSWQGNTKSATSFTVRATQKDNGSYAMDSRASVVSQKQGDMIVDENLVNGTSEAKGFIGGSQNANSVPEKVTNITDDYQKGYTISAYGAFLVNGSGKMTEQTLDTLRKQLEGDTEAQITSVSSGNFNAGSNHKPVYKYRTPQDTAHFLAQSALSGKVSDKLIQNMRTKEQAEPINLQYNLTALANNKSQVSSAELESADGLTAGKGEIALSGEEQKLGVSVQYLVKTKPVKSYISYAKLSYDENLNGKISIGNHDSVEHTLAEEGTFKVDSSRYYLAMVANSDANKTYKLSDGNTGEAFWNKLAQSITAGDMFGIEEYQKQVEQLLSKENTTLKSTTRNATVGVGSKNGDGYSVFVLEIDVPEKINVSTEIHLEDYQLNKIEDDILSPVQGILTNSGENVINPKNVVDRECAFSDEVHKIYRGNSSYNLKSTEYQKGITVDADRNSKTEKLVYYNKLLGESYTRDAIDKGVSDISTDAQKRYTYAFNLSRGLHGDKRTISALSMNSLPEQERNILTGVHKNTYGITPATKGDVTPVRDSKAIYTSEIKDSFSFSSLWSEGGKQPSSVSVLVHKGIKQTEDGDVDVQDTYQVLTGSGARPLSYKGFPIYQLDIDVKETIYKYSTAVMEVGKTLYSGDKEYGTLETGKRLNNEGFNDTLPEEQQYRLAVGANAECEPLSFYPEVRMRAYFTNGMDTLGGGSIIPRTVLTMAEEIRRVQPKSMYLMRLDVSDKRELVSGNVYSETMATGSNAKRLQNRGGSRDKNMPVIYGGSDITLNVKEVKPQLRMYGYALDMVNYDKDKNGFKLSEDTVIPYTSVVNDTSLENRDPYTTWGNSSSSDELFEQYVEWATSVKKNLYADITLKVEGKKDTKEFNNFNVSMASLVSKDEQSKHTETSQYPIYIRRGEIDTSGIGYQALLKQIASDYQCSEQEAVKLFEESNMYQTILKGIEDIKDELNKSQNVNTEDNGAHAVRSENTEDNWYDEESNMYQTILKGIEDIKDELNKSQNVNTEDNGAHAVRSENTEDNWYDEEVKVFLIRRYESQSVEFKNIILTDKLDYNLAPDSTAGRDNRTTAQQGKYNSNEGKWYLTVYLKNDREKTTNLYLSEHERYAPDKGMVDTSENYFKGGSVLINNLHIDGADFKIPSATTSEMLR